MLTTQKFYKFVLQYIYKLGITYMQLILSLGALLGLWLVINHKIFFMNFNSVYLNMNQNIKYYSKIF